MARKPSPRKASTSPTAPSGGDFDIVEHATKGKVRVDAGLIDPESLHFADDIREMLRKAGYDVADAGPMRPDSAFVYDLYGVYVDIHSLADVPPTALQLSRALQSAGIGRGLHEAPSREPGSIWVIVAPRF